MAKGKYRAKKRNNRSINPRESGWCWTKSKPHGVHPAKYKMTSDDGDVVYLVFTHAPKTNYGGTDGILNNIELSASIDREERKRGGKKHYISPFVYEAKRDNLGSEAKKKKFQPLEQDSQTIGHAFNTCEHRHPNYEKINKTKK